MQTLSELMFFTTSVRVGPADLDWQQHPSSTIKAMARFDASLAGVALISPVVTIFQHYGAQAAIDQT